jgi:hypothetical protein
MRWATVNVTLVSVTLLKEPGTAIGRQAAPIRGDRPRP